MTLSFAELDEAKAIDDRWQDTVETMKRTRTVFAQRRLKPEDVLPEWKKSLAVLGGKEEVQRFTARSLARFGGALDPISKSRHRGFKAPLSALPEDLRERLEGEEMEGTLLVDFDYPPAPRCTPVLRSHPLVSVLAETMIERTLGADTTTDESDPATLGRVGCWVASNVEERALVVLVRLRHQLTVQRKEQSTTLLVEEATAIAWIGEQPPLEGPAALDLLSPEPVSDPPLQVRERSVANALRQLETRMRDLDAFVQKRAQLLLEDHRRVRKAAVEQGRDGVKALLPADVIAAYVLLPKVT